MHPDDQILKIVTSLLDRNLKRLEEANDLVAKDIGNQEAEAKDQELLQGAWLRSPLFRLGGLSILKEIISAGQERLVRPSASEMMQNSSLRKILETIDEMPGINLGEISSAFKKSPTNLSPQISKLENEGLILKIRDGREKKHYTTPYGISSLELTSQVTVEDVSIDSASDYPSELKRLFEEVDLTEDNMRDMKYMLENNINLMNAEQLANEQVSNSSIKNVWIITKRPLELDHENVLKSTANCLQKNRATKFCYWLDKDNGRETFEELVEALADELDCKIDEITKNVSVIYIDFSVFFADYLIWNPHGKARRAFMNDTDGLSTTHLFEITSQTHVNNIFSRLQTLKNTADKSSQTIREVDVSTENANVLKFIQATSTPPKAKTAKSN